MVSCGNIVIKYFRNVEFFRDGIVWDSNYVFYFDGLKDCVSIKGFRGGFVYFGYN